MSRPLKVTMIVMAYAQERLVGEAVRAALGQEGEPIEILISDDGSPDGTWAAIGAAVEGYAGPHRVRLNRNDKNLGITGHINHCVALASGDVLVYAAGDDVSLPHRARRIRQRFEDASPLLVHSLVEPIGVGATASGETTPSIPLGTFARTTDPLHNAGSMSLYVGASGAWHRDLFRLFGPLPEDDCWEDVILGFRAALSGRVSFIDEPLVRYRIGSGVTTVGPGGFDPSTWRSHRLGSLRRDRTVLRQRLTDAATAGLAPTAAVSNALRLHLQRKELRIAMHEQGVASYLAANAGRPWAAMRALLSEHRARLRAQRASSRTNA